YRVDILVYDRKGAPLAVVECKKPEVELDGVVLDQAVRYNMVLNVKYLMITNGRKTCICRREEGSTEYRFLDAVPSYEEMIKI
ncbi:MAG: type I restriction enzyme HsdR N-terminal domain-containing protein, partial [Bacteroidales bacterium]|nr:type I restriction enzyme HsdR N-terminal domain-containing protein [Bacteroidales bacterium]